MKLDWDEIRQDCSQVNVQNQIFDKTSSVQDGGHDVISYVCQLFAAASSQYFPQVSAYTPVNHKMQCSLLVRQAQKYRQFTDYYGYGCHSLYIHLLLSASHAEHV